MKKESDNMEKDVEKIFDEFKNKKLEKVIKKARWQSVLRNMLISFLVLCVSFIAISYFGQMAVSRQEGIMYNAVFKFNNISAPNKYMGKFVRYHGFLVYRNEYSTYKLLMGKVVFTGKEEYSYGLFYPGFGKMMIGTEYPPILGFSYDTEDLKYRKYNEFGLREMVFFYPFVRYDTHTYMNDLDLLDDIGNEKYIEMALSFDREYTLDEVEKIIPKGVTVTWYWVDDLSENEKEMSKSRNVEQEGTGETIYMPARIRSEYTAYGIKLYYGSGEKIPDPVEFFIRFMESDREDKTIYKNEFDRLYNNIAGDDGKLTQDDIRIWGAVVTGNSESLKVLIGLPFIKASSLGVVTDKY